MNFLHPEILFLLILPLLLAAGAVLLARRKNSRWTTLVSDTHKNELLARPAPWRRILPTAFCLIALALAVIALARPYSGYTERQEISTGRNILLAIDVSRSMETKDVSPSRIEQARTAAYELMDALPDDNFGLIVFSGDATLAVPLTHDHNALRDAIEQINRSWSSYGGTNLNNVLECALDTFKQHSPDTTNALIILSDGEDTVGNSLGLVERAKKEHLIVMTVGIGTKTGDVIPDETDRTGLYRDNNGQNVISKLNDQSLINLAQATDGKYYAINSGNALAAFVRTAASKLEAEEQADQKTKIPNEQYTLFTIPSLLFILLAIIIGTEWRPWKRKTAILLLLLAFAPALQAADLPEEIRKELELGNYETVTRKLANLNDKDDAEQYSRLQFAKGYAELKQNKPDEAKQSFSQALLSENRNIQASALYNMGNINVETQFSELKKQYQTPSPSNGQPPSPAQPDIDKLKAIRKNLDEAVQSYEEALKDKPDFPACRNNLTKTQAFSRQLEQEIKRLEEEKQKQDQQQDQKNDQNKQDQQKQDQKNDQNKQDQQQQDQKNDQNKQDQQKQDQKDDQNKQDQQKQDQKSDQNKQDQQKQDQKNDQNKQDQQKQDQKNDQNKQDQQQQDQKNDQNKQDQQKQDQKDDQNQQDQQQQDQKDDQNKQDQQKQDQKSDQNKQQPLPSEDPQQPEKMPEAELAPSKEAKEAGEKHRATQILRMHINEEKGAPYPVYRQPIAPPTKDY